MTAREARNVPDERTPWREEAPLRVDAVAAFVDEPMVAAAEQEQVAERGRAASRPVVDVVGVEEAAVLAAGKAAAAVAPADRPGLRSMLHEELGTAPSPATQALHRSLL